MGQIGGGHRPWVRSDVIGWRRPRRPENVSERRVLGAVRRARDVVSGYAGGRPITTGDVRRLAQAFDLDVRRSVMPMDVPAVLMPRWKGKYRLVVEPGMNPLVLRHVTLHEIGHILTGDIEEPTILVFKGPLPEAEDICDLFSLLALVDPVECEQGPEFLETRIRELVPLDNYGWQTYRVPRLAGKLVRLRSVLEDG